MSQKRWIKSFLILSTISISFVVSINYIVDPFNVFNSGFLEHSAQHNERYLKIKHLEKNHSKYNSYIFGSSRIGTTDPKFIEKYIPGSKFYNMTVASANLYDYIMHLKYMLKNKYEIKNLYLQIDIRDMERYGQSDSDYQKRLHPYVTGDSLNKFYLKYLFGVFPRNIKEKITHNIDYQERGHYFLDTSGMWTSTENENKLLKNCEEYVKNEKTFHIKVKRNKRLTNASKISQAIKNIVELCEKNNINLYVFTTPHNHKMMDSFMEDDYKKFLDLIANETNFYDFSGYNSITNNNCNYYEKSHYRPLVAEIIAAKVFNAEDIKVPEDFGVYIKPENIEDHIKALKDSF